MGIEPAAVVADHATDHDEHAERIRLIDEALQGVGPGGQLATLLKVEP